MLTKGLKLSDDQGPPRFVPQDRIDEVLGYASDRPIRQLAVDLWCFSYLAWGMRYADLCLLKWTHIEDGWLRLSQHKTKKDKRAKLDDRAVAILDRYRGGAYVFKVCGDEDTTPKQRTNRLPQINAELRLVGKELGLPHNLTTHTARHTWTEWAIRNNVPWSRIMQMLGVRNMRAFERYIAGFNQAEVEEVADRFAKS